MNKNRVEQSLNITGETKTKTTFRYSDYKGENLFICSNTIIRILIFAITFLTLASLAGQLYRYYLNHGEERFITRLFNLDEEINLPTYFSSFLLLAGSFLFLIIGWAKKITKDMFFKNWFVLGIIFFFMSIDEILMWHEQMSAPIRSILKTQGFFYFAWLIPAGISLIIFLIFNLKFLLNLKYKYQILFITSGFIYLSGAFLVEMIGGKFLSFYGQNNLSYAFITTIEELLEMSGLTLLIHSQLSYIKSELPSLNIRIIENLSDQNKIQY